MSEAERLPQPGNVVALTMEERVLAALAAEQLQDRLSGLSHAPCGGAETLDHGPHQASRRLCTCSARLDCVATRAARFLRSTCNIEARIATQKLGHRSFLCCKWTANGGLAVLGRPYEQLDDDALEICIPSALFDASVCPQCENPVDGVGALCVFCILHDL